MKRIVAEIGLVLMFVVSATGCGRERSSEHRDTGESVVLNIASWGGSFQDALDSVVIQPTAQTLKYGARVTAYSGEYDRLAATIRDGSNTLDLVQVETRFLFQGAAQNLLAPIDWSIVDSTRFVPGATNEYGVATIAWSLVLAWNTRRLPDVRDVPSSWQDIFDLERFTGPRCLRRVPEGNLELALLADGVPPDRLYDGGLDVERALRKLSTIRGSISWWSSGTESEQKLTASCSLGALWNGRAMNLRTTAGQPVAMSYVGAIHQYDWWVIPANAPHGQEAMRFLSALGEGYGQEAIARQFGYGPVARRVLATLPEELEAQMPSSPDNARLGVPFNGKWWADNEGMVTERWNRWLLER